MSTIDVEMCIFSTDPISWTIQISKSICFEILDATKKWKCLSFLASSRRYTHIKKCCPDSTNEHFQRGCCACDQTYPTTQINITVTYTTTATWRSRLPSIRIYLQRLLILQLLRIIIIVVVVTIAAVALIFPPPPPVPVGKYVRIGSYNRTMGITVRRFIPVMTIAVTTSTKAPTICIITTMV